MLYVSAVPDIEIIIDTPVHLPVKLYEQSNLTLGPTLKAEWTLSTLIKKRFRLRFLKIIAYSSRITF